MTSCWLRLGHQSATLMLVGFVTCGPMRGLEINFTGRGHTHTSTDGHPDYVTELARWADSLKIYRITQKPYISSITIELFHIVPASSLLFIYFPQYHMDNNLNFTIPIGQTNEATCLKNLIIYRCIFLVLLE